MRTAMLLCLPFLFLIACHSNRLPPAPEYTEADLARERSEFLAAIDTLLQISFQYEVQGRPLAPVEQRFVEDIRDLYASFLAWEEDRQRGRTPLSELRSFLTAYRSRAEELRRQWEFELRTD